MLLQRYEQQSLLFNMNFNSATSEAGVYAYRGELILIEGEIADDQGRRKPPVAIARHTILLEKDEKLAMAVAYLDKLELLGNFIEKYSVDFAPDMCALFYVVNITRPMQLEMGGINYILIPSTDGIAWNELTEELGLEKSDFKGQSAADKIITAYKELVKYTPKYAKVGSWDEALALTADIKREARGPV